MAFNNTDMADEDMARIMQEAEMKQWPHATPEHEDYFQSKFRLMLWKKPNRPTYSWEDSMIAKQMHAEQLIQQGSLDNEVIAMTLQDDETDGRPDERDDERLAKEIQDRQAAWQMQVYKNQNSMSDRRPPRKREPRTVSDDERLAREIQDRDAAWQMRVNQKKINVPDRRPPRKGETRRVSDDERLAREIQDREAAWQMQIQQDKEYAESLTAAEHQPEEDSFPSVSPPRERQMGRSRGNGRGNQHRVPISRQPDRRQNTGTQRAADNSPGNTYEEILEWEERQGEVANRGIDNEKLRALPTFTYQSGNHNGASASHGDKKDEDETECKVCLGEFESQDQLRTLPCLHKYHTKCIDKWLQSNATCPICKLDIKEELKNS